LTAQLFRIAVGQIPFKLDSNSIIDGNIGVLLPVFSLNDVG